MKRRTLSEWIFGFGLLVYAVGFGLLMLAILMIADRIKIEPRQREVASEVFLAPKK